MSIEKILVPELGDFKDVEIIEVLVKPGQSIKKNDSLITLESDKSSVEVPSTHEGLIKNVNVKIGDKVNKGDLILLLEISKTTSDTKNENVEKKGLKENQKKQIVQKNKNDQKNKGKAKAASPKIRKFAREVGADIYEISGTERLGRVTEEDVKKFVKSKVALTEGEKINKKKYIDEYEHSEFGEVEIKDIPRVKKLSGPQLVRSWTEIPHVTQHDEIDITEMEIFRKSLRDVYTGEKLPITPLAFITRAVVKALQAYPNFNCSIDSETNKVTYKKYFHIGFAVDTPHGLMVPKLRNVENMTIKKISSELRRVSKLCRDLKIDKKEFFGGSMTISSLGGIGGNYFTPIINPPEVAILGVGKAFDKVLKIEGKYTSRKILPISLSYDHRIIDGAEGARFCVHLAKSLGKDFAFKLAV
tara:strand:+ start:8193 stop:9440 length:1248 start_codon:yes stop_codon:yes gene_type:complete